MSFNTNHSSRSGPATLSEINVTPFVDVMLVLLIVFMVSAPLMQQGVQVELPKANAGSIDEVPDQLFLVVKRNKFIYINDKKIPKGTLKKKLSAISSVKPSIQVFIQADRHVDYGFVAEVIATVKQSNIQRVGLVTEPKSSKSSL